jgi:aerotaxis receptor
MRSNLPVTQREFPFPDGVTLMSITDTSSHITYANASFIRVSGYDDEELTGQPHNVVRHPDMPAEAFADMWATLKAGDTWTGFVKNRRKNGDHYWVRANVTPMVRDGQVTGYMSVRTRPSEREIDEADALYAAVRAGRAKGIAFHKGIVVRTGLLAWMSWFKVMSLDMRLGLACAIGAVPALVAAFALGLGAVAIGVMAGAVFAGMLVTALLLHAQVMAPIGRILDQASRLARGEPPQDLHLDRVDEIGMLSRAVNQSGLNLSALIDDVSEQSAGVAEASQQIAEGNHDLSSRTEGQASNLEQTAASMEQMTATVKQNADAAREASQLAQAASSVAEQGGAVVGQVMSTMDEITASSRRIADIIGVIDGIAFQTNILALNAAVEAARAGEQGRGFAVVAGEVRTLAQRSAQAAREIKALIGASVGTVENGSKLVSSASSTMTEIVGQVRRVTDLINEMTHSSFEQSSGIGQVNQAVTQLDQMTQQNAALVEESAAAAETLRLQANRLSQAVGIFRRTRVDQLAQVGSPARPRTESTLPRRAWCRVLCAGGADARATARVAGWRTRREKRPDHGEMADRNGPFPPIERPPRR